MSDYRAEIERRNCPIRRYLEPMDRRAHEEAQGSCFLIFENRKPGEDPGGQTRELHAAYAWLQYTRYVLTRPALELSLVQRADLHRARQTGALVPVLEVAAVRLVERRVAG